MKLNRPILASIITLNTLLILLLPSCKEDFKVAAPYKNYTAIYGLLNISDTAHYIRIQKAFMDENKSGLAMAKEPDSNFYNALEVKIFEMNGTTIMNTFTLPKVDLINEGYPKDSGTFFNTPNYAYKLKQALNPNYTYRLWVKNSISGEIDSAETSIIDTVHNKFSIYDFDHSHSFSLNFPLLNSTSTYSFIVSSFPSNTAYAEATIRFHYVDKNLTTAVQTDKYIDWSFDAHDLYSNNTTFQVLENSFYAYLAGAISPAPSNIERYVDSCDFYIWAANSDWYNYMINNQTQFGLTADQIKPNYTTIKGNNVLGVFANRASRVKINTPVTDATLTNLQTNIQTAPLKFVGRSDH